LGEVESEGGGEGSCKGGGDRNSPDDEDSLAALRVQLKKLLEQDEELMKAIAQILAEDAPDGTSGTKIVQNVTGNQNQVIGQVIGNITGNVTI
jgi:hypothetical protein